VQVMKSAVWHTINIKNYLSSTTRLYSRVVLD